MSVLRKSRKTESPRVEHCIDSGKTKYSKLKHARTVANRLMADKCEYELRIYKCSHCNMFHLTKSKRV